MPKTTGITNENGLLSFGRLKPGTYSLKEVGGDWCHAKSDNVDAQGNLIVRAGQRTNVWIFNCVPTKQPPNTGSGAMAGVIGGGRQQHRSGAGRMARLADARSGRIPGAQATAPRRVDTSRKWQHGDGSDAIPMFVEARRQS